MIEYKTGDILAEDAEALVNTVNCVGVMGRGIALQFKRAFPDNFKIYASRCKRNEIQPGRVFVYETRQLTGPRYIINFPTKRHWRAKSRMQDIESGLASLAEEIRSHAISSVAIPPLGSGLGGLKWPDVRKHIQTVLQELDDVRVVVFEPDEERPVESADRSVHFPKMTTGRAALVGLLDPSVSLLEVHKLMYFMQAAGEPLKLNFAKGHYGPYVENLRHVLLDVEGHYTSGYADRGEAPDKQLKLVPGAIKHASVVLERHPRTFKRFNKVTDLVEGFESPLGLELLSTVHWVVSKEQASKLGDVVARTYAWNSRKQQLSRRQIRLAANVLSDKGWFDHALGM